MLTHQHDVWPTDDDFLIVSAFAKENRVRLAVVDWHLIDDSLDGFSGTDDGIKQRWIGFHGLKQLEQSILIGTLCR